MARTGTWAGTHLASVVLVNDADLLAGLHVPLADGAVITARQQLLVRRRPKHAHDVASVLVFPTARSQHRKSHSGMIARIFQKPDILHEVQHRG